MSDTNTLFKGLLDAAIQRGIQTSNMAESAKWFERRAGKVKGVRTRAFTTARKAQRKAGIQIGQMYFYKYDAKTKADLPYWDAIPLIFPFSEHGNYFTAINLHYAPPRYRAKIMDVLMGISTSSSLNDKAKLRMSYKALMGMSKSKWFQPLIKTYLKSHVRSEFIQVSPEEWPIALFLPLQSWRGGSAQQAYADFKKAINK